MRQAVPNRGNPTVVVMPAVIVFVVVMIMVVVVRIRTAHVVILSRRTGRGHPTAWIPWVFAARRAASVMSRQDQTGTATERAAIEGWRDDERDHADRAGAREIPGRLSRRLAAHRRGDGGWLRRTHRTVLGRPD